MFKKVTEFKNNSPQPEQPLNRTRFTHIISLGGKVKKTNRQPSNYEVVEYLGTNSSEQSRQVHLFRARDTSSGTYGFFIGELGDEFLNPLNC